ncbi:MAG: helix-hairpin-helix domain-containing protein, partial [Deltaproteobacteria bacterium]
MIRTHTHETEELPLSNEIVAARLDELAGLLEAQHANEFRVRAYRTAADTVRALKQSAADLLDRGGIEGLMRLPGIGPSLARTIERLTRTGRLPLLEHVRGTTTPERILTTVPGIGPRTAARIHDELGIDTLAELEAAACDGRLAAMPGMGAKRVRAVRESLAGRFRRRPQVPEAPGRRREDQPPVSELLGIDEEYRRKAAADRLLRIAPRRFNPGGEAWLPILHTHREERHYTALFSNTARAHELGMTHDWVVIYRDDRDGDGQWTVVTALFGDLKGRRIVRGRETECDEHYRG